MITLPSITSRVSLSTAGCVSSAFIPKGLLLSGGIAAPQALSTIHCARVMDAGMFQRRCEALAASMTAGGTMPIWPKGVGGGGVLLTSGRAANA